MQWAVPDAAEGLLQFIVANTELELLEPGGEGLTQRIQVHVRQNTQFLRQAALGARQISLSGLQMFRHAQIPETGADVFVGRALLQVEMTPAGEQKNLCGSVPETFGVNAAPGCQAKRLANLCEDLERLFVCFSHDFQSRICPLRDCSQRPRAIKVRTMLELQAVVLKAGAAPITHRFDAGRISVVLGRNHSGKTRLTRIVAGLEPPVAGELLLGGESLTDVTPGQRSVALVYQAFVNYPNWTVFENLASPMKARRVGRPDPEAIRVAVGEIARKLGLSPLLERYPDALSGGQQQRLAIGRALAKSADVLVMDEPLVNLDYKLRESLQLELRALLREFGMSVIYTTSDPRDAFALGDELLLMADHELLQVGAPLDVYTAPNSMAAADLMSDPRANRWMAEDRLRMIRPEHLYLEAGQADDQVFEVQVIGSETNGSETFIHCRLLDDASMATHWVARLDGLVTFETGSRQRLFAPLDSILDFTQVMPAEVKPDG